MPKLSTIAIKEHTEETNNMASLPTSIPIRAKRVGLRKKLPIGTVASASAAKKEPKRSESQELLANEERARALISRLN